MITRFYLFIFLLILFGACNSEDPSLSINIVPNSLAINSGESVQFEINGDFDFLVFYSGLEGQNVDDYPEAQGFSVPIIPNGPNIYSFMYNFHGIVNATFIASSYGNWGEDNLEERDMFTIDISDNNTDLSLVSLKTPGLFGEEFEGIIDLHKGEVAVPLNTSADLSKLTTNLITSSTRTEIYLDNQVFENKSTVDFTEGSRQFELRSVGGASRTWVIKID